MATVNFLYRSSKPKAFLHLRLLFRFENKDHVLGANTKLELTKDDWNIIWRYKDFDDYKNRKQ